MDKILPWDEILLEYSQGPEQLSALVQHLSKDKLDYSPEPAAWTIREITHHIVDGDDIWTGFFKQALGGDRRQFDLSWYWDLSQDEWAQKWSYSQRPIEPALNLLKCNREYVLSLLEAIDEPWSFCLEIPFPDDDPESWSVQVAMQMNTVHLQGHLKDIQANLNKISK